MTTGFLTYNGESRLVDVDDLLVRRELFADGRLWSWGYNQQGQLADNTSSFRSSPVTTVGGGVNWKQVAGGTTHSAGIKTDGTLWTWGSNSVGQLGQNSSSGSSRSSPVTTTGGGTNWKQVSASHLGSTSGIKTDGTLWTWGLGTSGQLGDNTVVNKSSPVTTVGGQGSWKQVSCGGTHMAAVKTDGTLWCWGLGNNGQLGAGNSSNRSSPVTTSGGGTTWKQVSAGIEHTAAVKTDGTLWTWGLGAFGRLGDNTTSFKSSPATTEGGGNNWKQVACGQYHTAAIKTDGTLWCFGQNGEGRLGDSTTSNRSSPVTTVGGQGNWMKVDVAWANSAAIKTDGTLWTWGDNGFGQIGDNQTAISSRISPVTTVAGGTNWKQVACGYFRIAAVTDLSLGSL